MSGVQIRSINEEQKKKNEEIFDRLFNEFISNESTHRRFFPIQRQMSEGIEAKNRDGGNNAIVVYE